MAGIKYIGNRESHTDNIYGTNLTWKPAQIHNVSEEIAVQMLKHTDVYVETVGIRGEKPATAKLEVPPEKPFIPLPNLPTMNKNELSNFAQMHYGEKLESSMKLEEMRQKVQSLLQTKGR